MSDRGLTGKVYDIQSFSLQDGPGIRTTVFLKGCPLRCPWCHSPESQSFQSQLSWMAIRCQGTVLCGQACIQACKKDAIELGGVRSAPDGHGSIQLIHVKRELCDMCGDCTRACAPQALSICGRDYTVDALVEHLLADAVFYEESGGGVTISGGEALSQAEFTAALLRQLKAHGIHTALDTTGYARWNTIEAVLPDTDLFLYDLKHMDSAQHLRAVGVPNEQILENARRIAQCGGALQIRIPLIPQFNDQEENLRKTAEFCTQLGQSVALVQLLPYHNLGNTKYARFQDRPKIVEMVPPREEKIAWAQALLEEYGLRVMVH